jgi:hypothetical protein
MLKIHRLASSGATDLTEPGFLGSPPAVSDNVPAGWRFGLARLTSQSANLGPVTLAERVFCAHERTLYLSTIEYGCHGFRGALILTIAASVLASKADLKIRSQGIERPPDSQQRTFGSGVAGPR